MTIPIVTHYTFDIEVLQASTPVLVDFFATWCGPCKALAATLEQVVPEVGDTLKIVKVDVEASEELAARYQVQSLPTVVLFKDGEIVTGAVGATSRSNIAHFLGANGVVLTPKDKTA